MVLAAQTRVEVTLSARSSYSKELHTRLAEHTRSEVAVGAAISNSDDKLTRLEVAVGAVT
jgi:hypothetical protein